MEPLRDRTPPVRAIRLLTAALILAAVAYQLTVSIPTGASVVNFFSYFTILSNVIAAISLVLFGTAPQRGSTWWPMCRGLATFAMVVTGVVYAALLSGATVDLTEAWVNTVLHRAGPFIVLLDWLVVAGPRIPWRRSLLWLLFPALYCGYSLLRGPVVEWYPYPFLDPRLDGGYPRVVLYVLVLAPILALLAPALAVVGRRVRTGAVPPG